MRPRSIVSAAACALALGLSACGGDNESDRNPAQATPSENPAARGQSTAANEAPVDPNDKRGIAYQCLTRVQGLSARFEGKQSIQVGAEGGPRIDFLTSPGEAEGLQFQGRAQGAEQIGEALLYVNQGDDELLKKIEDCLAG